MTEETERTITSASPAGLEALDLSDHFPTGLRSRRGYLPQTGEVIESPIQCECHCGEAFTGSDEQEVRQLWAGHIDALLALTTEGAASPSGLVDSEINELIERLEKRMARYGAARCHETVALEYADYSVMEDVGVLLAELKEPSSKSDTHKAAVVQYIDDRIVQFYAGELPYSGLAVRELTHVRHLITAPGQLPPDHPLHSMSAGSCPDEVKE